jgi:branched-chain amino acid transport system permease protein
MSAVRHRLSTDAASYYYRLLAVAVFVIAATIVLGTGPDAIASDAAAGLIDLAIVIGLYIFIGNSGILSFGHISFVAVGAYTAGIVSIPLAARPFALNTVPGFLRSFALHSPFDVMFAGAVAAVFAGITGVALMRLSGIAAGIATLSLLVVVETLLDNWQVLQAGGDLGGVPAATGRVTELWASLWVTLLAIALAAVYERSRFGLRLRASRDDERGAASVGVKVRRERWLAFVLSAFVCGTGGAAEAHLLGSFNPANFYLSLTFLTLAMLVVGGTQSLAGPVVGTFLIAGVSDVFQVFQNGGGIGLIQLSIPPTATPVAIAVIVMIVIALRPRALAASGHLGRRLRALGRRRPLVSSAPRPRCPP